MIQAKELRIGNWIKSNNPHDGRFVKLKYFHEDLHVVFFYNEAIGAFVKDIVGIELTPEILKKCGFEFKPTGEEVYEQIWKIGAFEIWEHDSGFCHDFHHGGDVNHLHQLQNLYFALTGEELTFKPKKK